MSTGTVVVAHRPMLSPSNVDISVHVCGPPPLTTAVTLIEIVRVSE
jgi:hypothetical protein